MQELLWTCLLRPALVMGLLLWAMASGHGDGGKTKKE